ncbi:eukaryotic translation initiation factor 4E member 2, isoform CRA_c [Mus musculus]|nr:eukaryotic translation initiation factor 4E member 2, isoform CRA_c [Mus musculus]
MNNKFDALKDDDSGDHDQNEENSTQKDGEKEKTDRDKSQSIILFSLCVCLNWMRGSGSSSVCSLKGCT